MKFKLDLKRLTVCFLAVFGMGFFLSFLMLCGLGTDPCSFMNKAISLKIGILFGTWQLIMNALMLVRMAWDFSAIIIGTLAGGKPVIGIILMAVFLGPAISLVGRLFFGKKEKETDT